MHSVAVEEISEMNYEIRNNKLISEDFVFLLWMVGWTEHGITWNSSYYSE